jgi:hypothetical protein
MGEMERKSISPNPNLLAVVSGIVPSYPLESIAR